MGITFGCCIGKMFDILFATNCHVPLLVAKECEYGLAGFGVCCNVRWVVVPHSVTLSQGVFELLLASSSW